MNGTQMLEPKFKICPKCGMPPAHEEDGGGLIPETYFVCPLGHSWTAYDTED